MTDAESPASVFEMLYLFFPEMVRDVIYDNACHLLDYGLNRDVEFASKTRPLVDEFHHPGHTSCAASFNTGVPSALHARRTVLGGVHHVDQL